MNRNVSILIIILIILLIAIYLLVLRSRVQKVENNVITTPIEEEITEIPTPTLGVVAASPSAIATPSGKITPTGKLIKATTSSGSLTR